MDPCIKPALNELGTVQAQRTGGLVRKRFSRKGLTIFSSRQASKIPLYVFTVAFHSLKKLEPYVTNSWPKCYGVTGKKVGNSPLILEINYPALGNICWVIFFANGDFLTQPSLAKEHQNIEYLHSVVHVTPTWWSMKDID